MPWRPGPGAGFTGGRPWLRLGPDTETRNVETERLDPGSVLSLYRRLIALRAVTPALQVGSLCQQPDAVGDVVAYTRETPDQTILVVLNLDRAAVDWHLPDALAGGQWRLLLATDPARASDAPVTDGVTVTLVPDEGLILERVG
jgi:alpha-glucosidase